MEKAIISLNNNLEELKKEVIEQENQLTKELEQPQTQIQIPPKNRN